MTESYKYFYVYVVHAGKKNRQETKEMNSDMIPVWNRCNDYIYTIGELEEDESLVRDWALNMFLSCASIKTHAVYHAIVQGKDHAEPEFLTRILDDVHGDLAMLMTAQELHKKVA